MAEIRFLYRYPIKGLCAERLDSTTLAAGEGVAFDRYWALKTSDLAFDPKTPRFLPKRNFAQLFSRPQLATLQCNFNASQRMLTLTDRHGKKISGDLGSASGRAAICQFVAEFLEIAGAETVSLVSAPGHHFSDIPAKAVSIVNLASVHELSRLAGVTIDPLRFRANIYVDGLEPWSERNWVGKALKVNDKVVMRADEEIGRCKATHVNLQSGNVDIQVLDLLRANFGHTICGIYASAVCKSSVKIKPGDVLTLAE